MLLEDAERQPKLFHRVHYLPVGSSTKMYYAQTYQFGTRGTKHKNESKNCFTIFILNFSFMKVKHQPKPVECMAMHARDV